MKELKLNNAEATAKIKQIQKENKKDFIIIYSAGLDGAFDKSYEEAKPFFEEKLKAKILKFEFMETEANDKIVIVHLNKMADPMGRLELRSNGMSFMWVEDFIDNYL